MGIDDELLKLKNKIVSEEKRQSEIKIKLSLKLESLNNDFGCNSLEEAKEYYEELQTSKKDLQKLIENGIINLKNELSID